MNIAPFKLPSDDSKTIYFKKSDVETAMEFAVCTPDDEERMTTLYLNGRQNKELGYSDSVLWTVQDRRMALWWIFVESNVDLSMTALYECDRCTEAARIEYEAAIAAGEKAKFSPVLHAIDYNAADFADGIRYLTVQPFQETKHFFSGVEKNVKLLLLDGRAAEGLETLRNAADGIPDEPGNEAAKKTALAHLRIVRICYQFSVEDEPDALSEALEYRFDLISKMSDGDEFKTLVAKINLMNRDLAHGLDISVRDGVSRLRVPKTHVCPKYFELSDAEKAKESKAHYTTQLWINFRNSLLFPNIRLEGLADFGY